MTSQGFDNVSRRYLDSLVNASRLMMSTAWPVSNTNPQVFNYLFRLSVDLSYRANEERKRLWSTGSRDWMTPHDRDMERFM